MANYRTAVLIILAVLILGTAEGAIAACTTTLSEGANIASAVSAAAPGSVVCLNDGNYGTQNFGNIGKSNYVTVRAVNQQGATVYLNVGQSSYLKFDGLIIPGGLINGCSKNIQVVNSAFGSAGLTLDNDNGSCTNLGILIDNNTFSRSGPATWEGRLSINRTRNPAGITISNNQFEGVGTTPSDGVFVGDAGGVIIGPGNVFRGIRQSLCGGTHCDAIQLYGGYSTTIVRNYFENCDTFIMAPDGSDDVTVVDNVFNGYGVDYINKIQFGSASNLVVEHNTIYNSNVNLARKSTSDSQTTATVQNNIITGGGAFTTGLAGCTGCTFSYNLADRLAGYPPAECQNCTASNNLTGTPLYAGGGTHPATWAGWQLTGASPGYRLASDGKDIGATINASSANSSPPSPPPSLTLH